METPVRLAMNALHTVVAAPTGGLNHTNQGSRDPIRPGLGLPPMRLSLLHLTPQEYADLAADLGPDGAAASVTARVRRLRRAAAVRREALAEILAAEEDQPSRRRTA